MTIDTTVTYLHSGITGHPALTGQADAMLGVLNACLVDGWGAAQPDSIVIVSGVATVTRNAGHPFLVDMVAEISNATVTGGSINGRQKVLSITGTTWTFDATGISDQTATGGSISIKVASAGWEKPYSTTHIAAYKSQNVASTYCLLRVDDTAAKNARIVGYETMSDINTGLGPFPTAAQMNGGLYLPKSTSADATERNWTFIGDDRGFYLSIQWASGYYSTFYFGDFASRKSPDPYACAIIAPNADVTTYTPGSTQVTGSEVFYAYDISAAALWMPRAVSGVGSSKQGYKTAPMPIGQGNGWHSGAAGSYWMLFPNGANNELYLTPINIAENYSSYFTFRGTLPGAYFCPMVMNNAFAHLDRINGIDNLANRALRSIANSYGSGFIDVTGPWTR